VEKSDEKRPLRKTKRGWKDDIKMNLKKCGGRAWDRFI
jgi:hypothetical protein